MSTEETTAVDVMAIEVARLTAAGIPLEAALEAATVTQSSTEGKAASQAYTETQNRLAVAAEAAVRNA